MNRYESNKKIQNELNSQAAIPLKQENETDTANFAIDHYFNNENKVEDDIDTSLSMNGNIGAVLLPEDDDK
jgi:hypothetical protein